MEPFICPKYEYKRTVAPNTYSSQLYAVIYSNILRPTIQEASDIVLSPHCTELVTATATDAS